MKKFIQIVLVSIFFVGMMAQASTREVTSSNEAQKASQAQTALPQLAANCPKGCPSCWDQCSKSDECGSGHNCISTKCGNRCVAETTS